MGFFKKNKKKLDVSNRLKEINLTDVEREKSYMIAVPENQSNPEAISTMADMAILRRRAADISGLSILSWEEQNRHATMSAAYQDNTYQIDIYPVDLEVPEFYRIQHFFPDINMQKLADANRGLAVELSFCDDSLTSYHFQLKLIHALLPDTLAVLDHGSEKILSGKWVAMAASSDVPPAPKYIYTVQAVSDERVVWLHTHGLNRCGISELEILNSTVDSYMNHYTVLEAAATRLLDKDQVLHPAEPLYLARLNQDVSVVATLIPWQEALQRYPDDILGGKRDRREGHNSRTSVVFVYESQEDFEQGIYKTVDIYDDILSENPIYMFSNAETARMKALAIERIGFAKRAAQQEGNAVLVKLGLEMDEEYKAESNDKEHIWFELLEFADETINAKLTQEPYYVNSLHKDDVGSYRLDQVTDWRIYTPERQLSPDDVYLMDL